jgi:hypothetical protein
MIQGVPGRRPLPSRVLSHLRRRRCVGAVACVTVEHGDEERLRDRPEKTQPPQRDVADEPATPALSLEVDARREPVEGSRVVRAGWCTQNAVLDRDVPHASRLLRADAHVLAGKGAVPEEHMLRGTAKSSACVVDS